MSRPILPTNSIAGVMALYHDFQVMPGLGDLVGAGGSGTSDTTNFKTGTSALKVQVGNTGSICNMRFTIAAYPAPKFTDQLGKIWIYLYNDPADYDYVRLHFFESAGGPYHYCNLFSSSLVAGWNEVYIHPSGWSAQSGGNANNPQSHIACSVKGATGKSPAATFDSLYFGQKGIAPTCVLTFDTDTGPTIYSTAYPMMAAAGIKGTVYVWSGGIGGSNITLAQLQELYAAGWSMSLHSATHPNFTTLTDEQIATEISTNKNYLVNNGMPRAADHFAYPAVLYSAHTNTVLNTLGVKSARIDTPPYVSYPFNKVGDVITIGTGLTMNSTVSEANITTAINAARLGNQTLFVMLHGVEDALSNASFCTISRFAFLLGSLKANGFNVTTIDEWYNGLVNPRYRSLPVTRATVS
jgi:peptidoglycan/xylan/chitin deacetylase (PgdA/CDA1 family)